jgi:3-oxoacyl-[acyl-carrier protein] reductase
MSLNLAGKVAIVTGASKGIGAGIAKSLAAAGASVAVNYASSREGADKVVNEIIADGGKAFAVKGSVDNSTDVEAIFSETIKAYGRLDIVVNNAGVYAFAPIDGVTKEEFDREFGINVYGPILTTQQAVKHFPETGGSIINISSVVSTSPGENMSVYAATKGALDTLTRAHAAEFAPRKIRVNVVAPGYTVTEGTDIAGIQGSDFETNIVASTPLGRAGQPDDIARVVTFLASDDAAWVTGERISASGGLR